MNDRNNWPQVVPNSCGLDLGELGHVLIRPVIEGLSLEISIEKRIILYANPSNESKYLTDLHFGTRISSHFYDPSNRPMIGSPDHIRRQAVGRIRRKPDVIRFFS